VLFYRAMVMNAVTVWAADPAPARFLSPAAVRMRWPP
jgi:hypothetical protein